MLTIEIRFPGGRYHATPWNRQVNEGEVEWPPSPWRIARALVATWHSKLGPDRFENSVLESLVVQLGSVAPHYRLPAAVAAHSRHYMPQFEVHQGKTSKVFDTFLSVADEPLLIGWPGIELEDRERKALAVLLPRLGYLGRAESWVDATLDTSYGFEPNAFPAGAAVSVGDRSTETIDLLALEPPETYGSWREITENAMAVSRLSEKRESAATRGKDPERQKLTAAERRRIDESLPSSVFEALQADTATLKRQGWNRPPGTRWVSYVRPEIVSAVPARPRRRVHHSPPTAVRFAVASQVPPRLTEALSVAERVHVALVSRSDGHPVFTGLAENGGPLGDHVHAYILPEAHGRHGRISHITLYAEAGFDPPARAALSGLAKKGVWGHGGHDLQLLLVGTGSPEELAGWEVEGGACDLLVKASTWQSRTPFVPTRHPKATKTGIPKTEAHSIEVGHASVRAMQQYGIFPDSGGAMNLQIGGPTHELLRLLGLRGFPAPRKVTPIEDTAVGGKPTRWIEFWTRRKKGGGRRGPGSGFGFRVEFANELPGPIALGYGSHFGLGMFAPVRKRGEE